METEEEWKEQIQYRIISLYMRGYKTIEQIYSMCQGASPKDIDIIYNSINF